MEIDRAIIGMGLAVVLLAGCQNSDSPTNSKDETGGARIALSASIVTSNSRSESVASSQGTALESFKVAVADISIAKDLTTSGSGWSNVTGVFPLYSQNIGDFNSIDTTIVRDPGWQKNYIDFCDVQSVKSITTSRTFTIRDTGEYHWAIMNWAPFFRVKASIPLGNGQTVYTHDGTITPKQYENTTGTDGRYYFTQSAGSMFTGPSDEALVRKNNAGTWFRFLKPLRITVADLDSGNMIADTNGVDSLGKPIVTMLPSGKWNVMLVYDPEDFLYAGTTSSQPNGQQDLYDPTTGAYVHVPFLKATAVPFRDGESVIRETYAFTVQSTQPGMLGSYGMKLQLYMIGENVAAATVYSYPTDGKLAPLEVPQLFFAEEKTDGTLSLQGFDKTAIFDGFVRKNSVHQTGTVTWNPGNSIGQGVQVLNYEMTDLRKIN